MRKILLPLMVIALAAAAGCTKEDAGGADKAPKLTPEPAPKADTPPAPPADEAAAMTNKMKHCPSAVEGAETTVSKTDKVVEVSITGEGDAVTEIRERAKYLTELAIKEPTTTDHSGKGSGGGRGKCPVVTTEATLAAADIEGGTKLTLTPNRPDLLDRVFSIAQERTELLGAGVVTGKGDGSGAGAGAATPVKTDEPAKAAEPEKKTAEPAKAKAPPKKKAAADEDEGGW